jgi:fucose 4-O-acetylase-like acetyltransferase
MTTACAVAAATPPSALAGERLAWVDNLRTLLIVLVVNMHACVTYSHVGSWYVNESPAPASSVRLVFLFWQGHLQAFFMGLLFFLSGVFAHRSLERRGPAGFLRERARRLGLPALLFMLVIQPLVVYGLLGYPHVADRPSPVALYARYLASGRVLSGSGPMWFALALLFFCAVLAGWRAWQYDRPKAAGAGSDAPRAAALWLFALGVVVSTFLVRLSQPIGSNVLNFQLGFFPQYVAAFAAGVAAGRRGWLETLAASRRARLAGGLALIGGPVALAGLAWLGGPPPDSGGNPYAGGWNLRALGLATWEQLAGLGLALGLLAWFHARWNTSGPVARWLADRAFAVYVLHTPVLVALTPALRPWVVQPLVGALLLTVIGVLASFLVADATRRLPGLRRIL